MVQSFTGVADNVIFPVFFRRQVDVVEIGVALIRRHIGIVVDIAEISGARNQFLRTVEDGRKAARGLHESAALCVQKAWRQDAVRLTFIADVTGALTKQTTITPDQEKELA